MQFTYQQDIESKGEQKETFEPIPLLPAQSNWSRFFSRAPRYACYTAIYISIPALLVALSYYESGTLPENRFEMLKHYFGILGLETSFTLPMACINRGRDRTPAVYVI